MGKELKHLERTMRNFQKMEQGDYEPVINALCQCFAAESYVYTYMKERDGEKTMLQLQDEYGGVYIPIFLSILSAGQIEEQARENHYSTALVKFSGLLNLVTSYDDIDGLIFEPFDFGFVATPPLLIDAAKRDRAISHITLISGDITEMSAEAMVCPTDKKLSGEGEIEKKIRAVVGEEEESEDQNLNVCDIMVEENSGEGVDVFDYDYFLFSVAPGVEEQSSLGRCYYTALKCARQAGIHSIMFPCIGTGRGGIDVDKAVVDSTEYVLDWLEKNSDYNIDVYFCCPDEGRRQKYQNYFDQTY